MAPDVTGMLAAAAEELAGNERDFLIRMWQQDPDVYRDRLRSIGFAGRGRVLDAGSGVAQWARCLGELNTAVDAIDVSPTRVEVSRRLLAAAGCENVSVQQGTIEQLPFTDGVFDAVFCFSVVYVTDYVRSLAELARVLRPGGVLYLNSNGLGWHVANIMSGRGSGYRSPRRAGLAAIGRTLRYRLMRRHEPGGELITSSGRLRRILASRGLTRCVVAPDGYAGDRESLRPVSFYPARRYGLEYVFEILATKERRPA
jgi:SAM-dependent methyltransferase